MSKYFRIGNASRDVLVPTDQCAIATEVSPEDDQRGALWIEPASGHGAKWGAYEGSADQIATLKKSLYNFVLGPAQRGKSSRAEILDTEALWLVIQRSRSSGQGASAIEEQQLPLFADDAVETSVEAQPRQRKSSETIITSPPAKPPANTLDKLFKST